jgi:hypothetical protein
MVIPSPLPPNPNPNRSQVNPRPPLQFRNRKGRRRLLPNLAGHPNHREANSHGRSMIQCPICKKLVTRRDDPAAPNRFFPFCSDRCKLIDLGRWLDGKYQIPAIENPGDTESDDNEDRTAQNR